MDYTNKNKQFGTRIKKKKKVEVGVWVGSGGGGREVKGLPCLGRGQLGGRGGCDVGGNPGGLGGAVLRTRCPHPGLQQSELCVGMLGQSPLQ